MTKIIFITATGTDMGKTYVTCLLLRQLQQQGYKVRAIKPLISGFDENALETTDSGKLLLAMNRDVSLENVAKISPWRFKAPLPPHLAAAKAGQPLIFEDIVKFCQTPSEDDTLDFLLIEGVGGVMVPLDNQHTTLDLMAKLGGACLMVAGSYLGTLSHSLSALACLKQRNITVKGLILSQSLDSYMGFEDVFEDFTTVISTIAPEISIVKLARNDQTAALAELIV